jgi:malonyl CoA-acyl carrier protein transacylase
MIQRGVINFIELGPKDVLSKLANRIGTDLSTSAVGSPAGISQLAS